MSSTVKWIQLSDSSDYNHQLIDDVIVCMYKVTECQFTSSYLS